MALSFLPTGLMPDLSWNCPATLLLLPNLVLPALQLLFGPGFQTERVHARFGLKMPRHRSVAAISSFFCTELLGLLVVLVMLGCPESLWVVLNVTCLTL